MWNILISFHTEKKKKMNFKFVVFEKWWICKWIPGENEIEWKEIADKKNVFIHLDCLRCLWMKWWINPRIRVDENSKKFASFFFTKGKISIIFYVNSASWNERKIPFALLKNYSHLRRKRFHHMHTRHRNNFRYENVLM